MPRGEVLDPIAKNVKRELVRRGIFDAQVAEALGITRSGLSKAFSRPGGLIPHLEKLSQMLGTTVKKLSTEQPEEDEESGEHEAAATLIGTPPADVSLPGGCTLGRVANESLRTFGRGRWVLLGPPIMSTRVETGMVVAVPSKDGWKLRGYSLNSTGNTAILTPKREGVPPDTIPVRRSPDFRVVMLVGERHLFPD